MLMALANSLWKRALSTLRGRLPGWCRATRLIMPIMWACRFGRQPWRSLVVVTALTATMLLV